MVTEHLPALWGVRVKAFLRRFAMHVLGLAGDDDDDDDNG